MGAASGRLDALVFMAGLVAGIIVFAEAYPALAWFVWSGGPGEGTLADLLGLPFPVLAAAVVLIALATFWALRKFEARLSGPK